MMSLPGPPSDAMPRVQFNTVKKGEYGNYDKNENTRVFAHILVYFGNINNMRIRMLRTDLNIVYWVISSSNCYNKVENIVFSVNWEKE